MELDEKTLEFVREHGEDDVRRLALQAARWPDIDMPTALQQIAGRQTARDKVPSWAATDGLLYPPHLSMEQCSSERTARYKSMLVEGDSLCDLTGGLGVDFTFMAQGRSRATYVERQETLCALARHNLPLLGLPQAQVVCADAEEYLASMDEVDTLYIDPARRDNAGNRVYAIADCTPDVSALASTLLAKAKTVIIKLSPMLDMHQALRQLPCVEQVLILAVGGECKEMVMVMRRGWEKDCQGVHCIDINPRFETHNRFSYTLDSSCPPAPVWDETVPPWGLWLFEPNATIMKAGCFDHIADRNDLMIISRDSHLLVADHPISDQYGRVFSIWDISTMNKRELQKAMKGITHANVAVRNFPMSAPELARRLKVKDGGDTYIFGTTTATGKHIIIICKADEKN
jgi:16S rRNA G966 N2-methylase RsmD